MPDLSAAVSTYISELKSKASSGVAREHSYRPALQRLLETLYPDLTVINEPSRIDVGAPDYIIQERGTPLGYVEAKDIGEDLAKLETGEQLERYRAGLNNLIFTDYLEFRWYVEGERRQTVRLAPDPSGSPNADTLEAFGLLLKSFTEAKVATVRNPQSLAKKMADKAQLIRRAIRQAFDSEDLTDDLRDPLHDQFDAFKKVLLTDLEPAEFADMYAQTITYGFFAARSNPNGVRPFTRDSAARSIPRTNPFLKEMFRQMMEPDLPESLDWIVTDLVDLLERTDIESILENFGQRTRQEDPIVHFYETFLKEYDQSIREARGVYYTPEPVVSYIVRSVDHILKTDFGLADGLADTSTVRVIDPERSSTKDRKTKDVHRVQILDPATGTATFLHSVIDQIHQTVTDQYGAGAWSQYVSKHLLPRLYGFEILMAPYTVAHMKLGLQLQELGYDFAMPDRLKVFLTNALEEAPEFASLPLFGQLIASESQEAGEVKQDAPVMVVIGNPPYSYESSNTGEWISEILRDYYKVDGKPLGERNPKGLQDDYVKFIRFSQWRIEQTGYGILAFITNHGYLDNLTFKGMR